MKKSFGAGTQEIMLMLNIHSFIQQAEGRLQSQLTQEGDWVKARGFMWEALKLYGRLLTFHN